MISKTLKQLVIKEAKNLKKHATKKELNQLDFCHLNPSSYINCIYGQITGDCTSERAVDLINKCATREYKSISSSKIENIKLNGKHKPIVGFERMYEYFSPIEVFIYKNKENPNKNEALIKFLKGEIKTLKL